MYSKGHLGYVYTGSSSDKLLALLSVELRLLTLAPQFPSQLGQSLLQKCHLMTTTHL